MWYSYSARMNSLSPEFWREDYGGCTLIIIIIIINIIKEYDGSRCSFRMRVVLLGGDTCQSSSVCILCFSLLFFVTLER